MSHESEGQLPEQRVLTPQWIVEDGKVIGFSGSHALEDLGNATEPTLMDPVTGRVLAGQSFQPTLTVREKDEQTPSEAQAIREIAQGFFESALIQASRLIPDSSRGRIALAAFAAMSGCMIATNKSNTPDNNTVLAQVGEFCSDAGMEIAPDGTITFAMPDGETFDNTPLTTSADDFDPAKAFKVNLPLVGQGFNRENLLRPNPIDPQPAPSETPRPTDPTPPPTEPIAPTPEKPVSREIIIPADGLRIASAPDALADWPLRTDIVTATYSSQVGANQKLIKLALPDGTSGYSYLSDLTKTEEVARKMKEVQEKYPDVETTYPEVKRILWENVPVDTRFRAYPLGSRPFSSNMDSGKSSVLGLDPQLVAQQMAKLSRENNPSSTQTIPEMGFGETFNRDAAFEVPMNRPFSVEIRTSSTDDVSIPGVIVSKNHRLERSDLSKNQTAVVGLIVNDNKLFAGYKTPNTDLRFIQFDTPYTGQLNAKVMFDQDRRNICIIPDSNNTAPDREQVLLRLPERFTVDLTSHIPGARRTTDSIAFDTENNKLGSSTVIRELSVAFPSSPEDIALAEAGLDEDTARILELQRPETPFRFKDIHTDVEFPFPGDLQGASDNIHTPDPSLSRLTEQFSGFYIPYIRQYLFNPPIETPDNYGAKGIVAGNLINIYDRYFVNGIEKATLSKHQATNTLRLDDRDYADDGNETLTKNLTGRELLDRYLLPQLEGYDIELYRISPFGLIDQKTGEIGSPWKRMLQYPVMDEIKRAYPEIQAVELVPPVFNANVADVKFQDNLINSIREARRHGFTVKRIIFDLDPPEGITLQDHQFALQSIKQRFAEEKIDILAGVSQVDEETFEWAMQFTKHQDGEHDAPIQMINVLDRVNEGRNAFYKVHNNMTVTPTDGIEGIKRKYVVDESHDGFYVVKEKISDESSALESQSFTQLTPQLEESLLSQGAVAIDRN